MFWDRFYSQCLKKEIKPNPLAKELGISSGVITKWKNGGIPNGETLNKIADYLDCSVDYLLGRTDNPQKTTSAIDEYLARIEAKEPNQAIIMHRNEKGGQEVIQLSEERLQRILKIIDLMDNEDKKQ